MSAPSRNYHVLIVEDDRVGAELLARRLARHGYETSCAESVPLASAAIEARMPDMILLDVGLPGVSGMELLRRLRKNPGTRTVPVIMVSSADQGEVIVEALKAGANDYVTKPLDMNILLARMETHFRFASMLIKLATQTELLTRLAAYDELTGIYNRRSLFGALEAEFARSRRSGLHLSALMLDIDFFKSINDTHGHASGDQALREVALRLSGAMRSMDILARYGGEEFCAILLETNADIAARRAERLRLAVAETPFPLGEIEAKITVSVGVATMAPDESLEPGDLLHRADLALLQAKRTGRNRVVLHDGASE